MGESNVKDKAALFEPKVETPPAKIGIPENVKAERKNWAAERWQVKSAPVESTKVDISGRMTSPEAIKAEREKAIKEEQQRALEERWRKTVEYAIKLQPDERMRVLANVPEDVSAGLRERAGKLREAAGKEIVDQVGKRIAALNKDADQYTPKWREDLTSKPKKASDEAAHALLESISHIEEQVHLDSALMQRVQNKQFDAQFATLGDKIENMRALYKDLQPKRSMGGDNNLMEPTKAQIATSLPLGDLAGKKKKAFEDLLSRIAGGMAADPSKPPVLEDIETEVKTITEALSGSAKEPADPAAELKAQKYSWEAVKDRFKAIAKGDGQKPADAEAAKTYMERMWWHRRKIVDETMLELQKKYGFDWASVGSANLESDYDISVKTHGKNDKGDIVYDWEIVKEFNDKIAKEHGGNQPGTIFDTNLYASAEPKNDEDNTPDVTDQNMSAMKEQGQDVGALMKMRRYMDWEEYEAFKQGVLKDIEDPQQKKDMLRQFEEADDLFFLSVRQQLVKAKVIPEDDQTATVTPDAQKELLAKQKALEKDSDKMMRINNEIYVEAMTEVRELEEKLKILEEGSKEYDATLAVLKTKQADAVFFAAEAYHSDGPFKHVVWADQAAEGKVKNDPETAKTLEPIKDESEKKKKLDELIAAEKKSRLAKISTTEMLQSFNENLGDLLKDVGHYEEKSPFPGLGFYRASKYLKRLCDTMLVMAAKVRAAGNEALAKEIEGVKFTTATAQAVKDMAAILTDVRGGKVEFKDAPDAAAEAEAYATDLVQKTLPGAVTLRDLGDIAKATGQAINAIMRREIAAEKMKAKDDKAYFATAGGSGTA
jgi:hypothetical protein